MPKITIPASDPTKSGSKFLLAPGVYPFALVDYKFGVSQGPKTAGCENVNLKFETTDGRGIWVFSTLTFAPSTLWVVGAFLRCFGVPAAEGQEIDVSPELLASIVGHTGRLQVKNEPYNGQMQNKLAAYVQPEASGNAKVQEIKEEDIPF